MEAFSKIIAVVIMVIAVFIAPLFYFSIQNDRVLQSCVAAETTSFVDNVRLQGKITQEMYNDYMKVLSNTGMLFDVEFEHAHVVETPAFSESGALIGTKETIDCVYENDIRYELFNRDTLTVEESSAGDVIGEYHLRKDDYFTVIVKNRSISMTQRIMSLIDFPNTGPTIFYKYGGAVRDENY